MPDEGVRREKAHAASVFDPEDSGRFCRGTDWRFLNELKKELKG